MQISFARSGGLFYSARKAIKGTIRLQDGAADVSSDAAYHRATYRRALAPGEAEELRTGADPVELEKASQQIASERKPGAADLDDYQITVTTQDGKSHQVHINLSPDPKELQGVSPATANLLRWIQHEADKIKAHGLASE